MELLLIFTMVLKCIQLQMSLAQDLMSQFKLTTPYDVSTLSLEGTYTVDSVSVGSTIIVFSNDGSKMFIIDIDNIKFMNSNKL